MKKEPNQLQNGKSSISREDNHSISQMTDEMSPSAEGAVEAKANEQTLKKYFRFYAYIRQRPALFGGLIVLFIVALIGGYFYWSDLQSKVYIEKSEIIAPIISLAPKNSGEIDRVYVKEGDFVSAGQNLVKISGQVISAKVPGVITWVGNTPGQLASSQTPLVKMVDPSSLRVVGHIQEDKGLSDMRVGQKVVFTVDAFASKQYFATVEIVGTSSRQSSIVFSISDKREEREFDVTAIFDVAAYPELKNGMSAKMWVIK